MWANFTERFEWCPHPRQVIVYQPGMKCSVTHRCGEAAVAQGKAIRIETPRRDEVKACRRGG